MIDFDTLFISFSIWSAIVMEFASREFILPFVPAFCCGLLFWVVGGIDTFIVKLSGRVWGWTLWPPFIVSLGWAFITLPVQPDLLEKHGFWGDLFGRLMQSVLFGSLAGGAAMYVPFIAGGLVIMLALAVRHPLKTADLLLDVFSGRRCH